MAVRWGGYSLAILILFFLSLFNHILVDLLIFISLKDMGGRLVAHLAYLLVRIGVDRHVYLPSILSGVDELHFLSAIQDVDRELQGSCLAAVLRLCQLERFLEHAAWLKEFDIELECAIKDISPSEWLAGLRHAGLVVISSPSRLPVADEHLLGEVVDLVGGVWHILDDDKVRV